MGKVPSKRAVGNGRTGQTARASVRSHAIYVEGKPHPKGRPRFTARNGKAVAYTPAETVKAEKAIADAWDGPMFEGEVSVHVVVDTEGTAIIVERIDLDTTSKLRGDLDNYLKTVLDGLNGVAWKDDSQVVRITGIKV